ncbi:hypothetical protein EVAR_95544_1 [Eumeta japonica]|uniref:Uncharacterized protein n=1 Tax=Eumeta variegata TaxID=151549 RepID=A0A4C1UIR6_EUMVA|nr:hypothetical protein EVAR_95544_1 [Eumeta japonica]
MDENTLTKATYRPNMSDERVHVGRPSKSYADRNEDFQGANEHASRQIGITAAHGHSLHRSSHQYIADLSGRNSKPDEEESGLMEGGNGLADLSLIGRNVKSAGESNQLTRLTESVN